METDETENGNGKLKRKTEMESGNGKAEIWKWSSQLLPFAHARTDVRVFLSINRGISLDPRPEDEATVSENDSALSIS